MQTLIRWLLEASALIFGMVLTVFVIVAATLFFGIKGMVAILIVFILFIGCLGYLQTLYTREQLHQQTAPSTQPVNTDMLQPGP